MNLPNTQMMNAAHKLLLLLAAAAATATVQPARGAEPAAPAPAAATPSSGEWLSALAIAPDETTRSKAASALIALARSDRRAVSGITELLAGKNTPDSIRSSLLRAITTAPEGEEPADSLWTGVGAVLDSDADSSIQSLALQAAACFQSREAVAQVLTSAKKWRGDARSELVSEAIATLEEQTGRHEPTGDLAGWEAWFKEAGNWSRADWASRVARMLGHRARSARAQEDSLGRSLAELYRRLMVATPEDQRSPLIVEMLMQSTPDVVRLGLDLATRAVLNGQMPGESVARATAERLGDPDPSVRAAAASLLEKLDIPSVAGRVAEALKREQDPNAAAAMLRVLARHPQTDTLRDVAAWLDSTGPAFGPAVDATLALVRRGDVHDDAVMNRIHEVVRDVPADRLTPGCVALLGQVGKVDEVSPLLGSSRSEIVLAAGQALAETMAGYTPLLNAARRDPALFGSAILAIQRFDPSPDGFTTAESLPSPSPDRRRDALEKLAWSLPAPTLLIIAARQSDLTLRESYARRAEEGEFLASPADAQSKADLVVLLARTRLLLRNPAGALAALDAAGRANLACEGCVLPRVTALVWLNRLDEASALTKAGNLPARPWLDALAWAIESDHARAIRERIRELYSVTLTKQEQEELSALDARMGAPQGAAPNGAAMPQGVPSSSPPAVQPGPGTAPPGPGAHAGMGSAAATLGRASGASLSR